MKADKTFFIDFTNSCFNYFHNDILGCVVSKFLEANPDLLLSEVIKKDNLEEVIMEVLANNLENVINPNGLYHIVENIYDFWRDYKRYLFADLSVSYIINETNFHDVFNNFNKTILDAYRRVCLNLGKKLYFLLLVNMIAVLYCFSSLFIVNFKLIGWNVSFGAVSHNL